MPNAWADVNGFAGVGSVLAGKYRVQRVVGTGGMGVVVLAEHLHLKNRVAIKFLLPRAIHRQKHVARFLREARAASRISGPHVVRVLDVDVRGDGVPYIVMEFLEGETLASLIRRCGPLGIAESVDYILEAAEALAEAHAAGIVHRDLKPANLFLARSTEYARTIKVLDFGIAKNFDSDDAPSVSSVTTSEAFMGSPPYMSPEQLSQPGNVDARTDIWSLGVVLYECLTGASPFASPGVGQMCARIMQEAPAPVSTQRTDAPQKLDRILSRCLAKSKEARFGTIRELARDLAELGTERSERSLQLIELVSERSPPAGGSDEAVDSAPSSGSSSALTDTETSLETLASASAGGAIQRRWMGPAAMLVAILCLAYLGARLLRHEPNEAALSTAPAAPPTQAREVPAPTKHREPAPASGFAWSAGSAKAPSKPAISLPVSGSARTLSSSTPTLGARADGGTRSKHVRTPDEDPESVYVDRK